MFEGLDMTMFHSIQRTSLMKKWIGFAWRGKLIAIMLSVVVIVLAIMTWLNMDLSEQTITKREMSYNDSFAMSTLHSVDNTLKDMSRVSLMMFSDPRSPEIVKNTRTADYITQANNCVYLDTLFNNLITIREEVGKIHIFDLYGLIYNLDMKRLTNTSRIILNKEPWYELLINESNDLKKYKGCIILGARLPDYFRRVDYLSLFEQYHFSVVREIKTFSPYKTIGFIEVMAPVSILKDIVEKNETDSSVILLDQFLNVIYEPTGKYIGRHVSEAFPELSGVVATGENHTKLNMDGTDSLITVKKSEVSSWTIATVVPVSLVRQSSIYLRNIVILISAALLAIVIPIVILLARKLTKPLVALSNGMRRVRKGDDNVVLPIINNDEIGWLTEQFNIMISEASESNYARYEALQKLHRVELLQKETELLYLRNQINPHFLYNILDSIRMTAGINGDHEVAGLIMNLANFFRMSISNGSNIVPLSHEISMIKNYMSLMKLRYRNIKDEYNIDEAFMNRQIPNFILQPIVENAIIHGLKEMDYNGTITISVSGIPDSNEDFMLAVSDTGISMSDEKMAFINMRLQNKDAVNGKETRNGSIGLLNVQRRIRIYLSEDYGISIQHNPDGGTIVYVKLSEIDNDSKKE